MAIARNGSEEWREKELEIRKTIPENEDDVENAGKNNGAVRTERTITKNPVSWIHRCIKLRRNLVKRAACHRTYLCKNSTAQLSE